MVMPGFHPSVAVSPLLLRKFRKNSVSAELRCMREKSVALLPFQLPLRRSVANRIESYFCRSAIAGQPISVLVTSSLYGYGKTFPAIPFSRATATVATEWNYGNGTTERQWQHGN